MFFSRPILKACFVLLATSLAAQWPDNLTQLKKSMCLVEYYQPQSETKNIKDDARIKRKITGILVTGSGLVITSDLIFPVNLDIVSAGNSFPNQQKPPEDITVSFDKEKKYKAQLIGKDEELRLAFIQINDSGNFPAAITFKSNKQSKIGDPLYIIQHLDGRYDNELFVSACNINAVLDRSPQKLLSDITLQSLSPGGLVTDGQGNAIGVVFRSNLSRSDDEFEIAESPGENGVTEILPARYFVKLIENPPHLPIYKEGGGKSWLGIQMQILSRDMAEYWGLINVHGIIVSSVVPRSPAEKAKLQTGDIITSIGTFQIKGTDEKIIEAFRNYIRSLPEGEIQIHLIRDHQSLTLPVYLESAPKSQFLAEEFFDENLGLRVQELTQDLVLNYDLNFDTEGVWVSRVEEAGPASLAGLEVNDLILSIDDSKMKNLADFRETIRRLEQQQVAYIEFFIRRNQTTQYLFIKTGFDEK
jgi:serine protease Do